MPRISMPFRRRQSPNPPETDAQTDEDGHELRMGLFDHLAELRNRVLKAFMALVIGTGIGIVFAGTALDYLRGPYCQIIGEARSCELVVLGPTEGVITYFRVALMLGGIIAIPVMTYQLMMFIVPGLTRKERRYVLLSIPPITLLFLIGTAFAWFILMPPALGFLEGFEPTLFRPEWTANLYLSFVTALIFWMGVAFETPLVFFVLSLLGLVRADQLARNWRFAVVASSIAAAIITPTVDPFNMFLVMGPLLALYVISIGLVHIGYRMSSASQASTYTES